MSGPGFASLYYTDCVPGQGLRGGAGFQFQAVSAGVSHDLMALVQRSALYEAPVAWMREQRAVEDYPPSLAHVHDGVYATARGRYLGAEANGVREGNQFTHAIATSDPELYGLTRPAQLWDAPWWVERPAPSTECPPVEADPQAGPWGIDLLREWVLGRPDGADWLLAVHSAVDRVHDGGQRVLFVGTDPAPVLGWIAAGTVLLAQSRALRVGFRVFTTSPRQSRHEVVAVHEDWAGPLANPDRDNGFVVFNLSTGRHSAVEPTEGARFWVPRFLDADPYDVVDAIELTQRFAGPTAQPSATDRLAGAVVVLAERPATVEQAAELAGWLRHGPADLAEDVLRATVDAALTHDLDLAARTDLRAAVTDRGLVGPLADRVTHALFTAELEADLGTRLPAGAPARSLLETAELAAATAPPERLDPVLRTATRYQVTPRVGAFADAARRFVAWTVDRPARPFAASAWSCGPELLDLFRDEVAARLDHQRDTEITDAVRRHWWPVLLASVTDPTAELDATVTAAAMEHGDPAVRRDTARTVLARLRGAAPADRAALVWRALFSYSWPTLAELTEFLGVVGDRQLTGWCAEHTMAALAKLTTARPTAAALDALALAVRRGAVPGPDLAAVAAQDRAVRDWLDSVRRRTPRSGSVLAEVGEPVLAARWSTVIEVLVDELSSAQAAATVHRCGRVLPALLVRDLPAFWRADQPAQRAEAAVALAFVTAHLDTCPERLAVEVERPLLRWTGAAEEHQLRRVEHLLTSVGVRHAAQWREFVAHRPRRGGAPKRVRTERRPAAPASSGPPGDDPAKQRGWRFPRRQKGG